MNDENKSNLIEFLYQSITDIQSTIRAIDTKVTAFLAILIIPLTISNEILSRFDSFLSKDNLHIFLGVLYGFSWLLAILLAFRTLISISNPTPHIKDNHLASTTGKFYDPSLFSFDFFDYFINTPKTKSALSPTDQLSQLPPTPASSGGSNQDIIINELNFEKMKLTFIRDIKMYRSKACINITFFWFILHIITNKIN